jgi:hypothetical protein
LEEEISLDDFFWLNKMMVTADHQINQHCKGKYEIYFKQLLFWAW